MPTKTGIFGKVRGFLLGSKAEDTEFRFLKLCQSCEIRKSLEATLKRENKGLNAPSMPLKQAPTDYEVYMQDLIYGGEQ